MTDSTLPPSSFGTGSIAASKLTTPSVSSRQPAGDGKLNGLAVASFVLALFVGVLAPMTIVMACVARAQIRASPQVGAGLAKAALVISCVYLFAGAVVVVLYVFVR